MNQPSPESAEAPSQVSPSQVQGRVAPPVAYVRAVLIGGILLYVLWVYLYMFEIRPIFNSWLAGYGVPGYPMFLHLIPIIGVPILVCVLVAKAAALVRGR